MSSSSAQQLANFTLLHYDKSTSARTSPCFLYLIAECSSLYVAKWALALFLVKNNRFIILHNNAVFQMPFYSPCKHTSLYFTADFFQVRDMITVVYSFNILLNNRPFIYIIRYVMGCRSN